MLQGRERSQLEGNQFKNQFPIQNGCLSPCAQQCGWQHPLSTGARAPHRQRLLPEMPEQPLSVESLDLHGQRLFHISLSFLPLPPRCCFHRAPTKATLSSCYFPFTSEEFAFVL